MTWPRRTCGTRGLGVHVYGVQRRPARETSSEMSAFSVAFFLLAVEFQIQPWGWASKNLWPDLVHTYRRIPRLIFVHACHQNDRRALCLLPFVLFFLWCMACHRTGIPANMKVTILTVQVPLHHKADAPVWFSSNVFSSHSTLTKPATGADMAKMQPLIADIAPYQIPLRSVGSNSGVDRMSYANELLVWRRLRGICMHKETDERKGPRILSARCHEMPCTSALSSCFACHWGWSRRRCHLSLKVSCLCGSGLQRMR